MISSEAQLMENFGECGFDFTSTTRDIAVRFPKELDWGVQTFGVLKFELKNAFAKFGTVWKIPVNREVEFDLPPTRYFHEFHPFDNVRKNFNVALKQLTALFGSGQAGPATNVYERNWNIGFFSIRVVSFPRSLNPEFRNNVFEGKNPYLGISANVHIRPDFPFVTAMEDASQPINELLLPPRGARLLCDSQVYARRNLVPIQSREVVGGLVRDAFLVRTNDRTIRVPLEQIQKVVLTRLTPSRFSGGSSVSLFTIFCNRHDVRVLIAEGIETHSLDNFANQLSRMVGRPLTIEEYPDDG